MRVTRRSAIGGAAAAGAALPLWSLPAMAIGAADEAGRGTDRLRFAAPAARWFEALPVGNGRIGAMVHGGVAEERIPLNHIELWSGRPSQDDRPGTAAALPEVRRLLFAGRYAEANALAQARMMTPMNAETYGSYQMLGELLLRFDHGPSVTYEARELDLATGEVSVRYRIGDYLHQRTILCSHPDAVLAVQCTTTDPKGIAMTVRVARAKDAIVTHMGDVAELRGRPQPHGTSFAADLACRTESGTVTPRPDGFRVVGARTVTLLLTAATDLIQPDPAAAVRTAMSAAQARSWQDLVARHRADHQRLYRTVSLELGGGGPPSTAPNGTAETENAIFERYFNFGRYLLIASSRPGSLPANLQGLWADGFAPPWGADYHININLQMNYWPAEVCGLGELHEPLFRHAETLLAPGAETARIAYGCRGSVAHYTSNPWGHVALDGDLQWGMWPEGLAWLSLHFWEHYRYSRDAAFLRTRALPILRACATFTLDYLVTDPRSGRLVAGPATSPENKYLLPNGHKGAITMGPAMSQSMAYAVLSRCRDAARILGEDTDLQHRCDAAIDRLQRLRIGADGRILEWPEPFAESEVGHRHVSHLFGLFPGYEIDVDRTPELAAAADRTLKARLAGGGGQTGWSAAWLTMYRARLRQGDEAHAMLAKLLRESTASNYFDTHPSGEPEPLFQIDGNFGATAAMAEMLMQSHDDRLRILPALPAAWPDGQVTGLRARGRMAVDILWRAGRAERVTLRPEIDLSYTLVPPAGQRLASVTVGGKPVAAPGDMMSLKAGQVYRLHFRPSRKAHA